MREKSDSAGTGAGPLPKCVSIILCDAVYQIGRSGRNIIVATFHELPVPHFPFNFPKITMCFTLTNGHGRYDVIANLVNGEGVPVAENRHSLRFSNPLSIIDELVIFPNVPLLQPGKYWAEVRCAGELIGQCPFHVVLIPPDQLRPISDGIAM